MLKGEWFLLITAEVAGVTKPGYEAPLWHHKKVVFYAIATVRFTLSKAVKRFDCI